MFKVGHGGSHAIRMGQKSAWKKSTCAQSILLMIYEVNVSWSLHGSITDDFFPCELIAEGLSRGEK